MELVILTGLSGSGKTTALAALEDSGFFCIDNLPIALLDKFLEILDYSNNQINKIAVVCDARDPDLGKNIPRIEKLKSNYKSTHLIFLDCDKRTLIRRFEQTRRIHPLSLTKNLSLKEALEEEEKLIRPLKDLADIVIDTTETNVNELRRIILSRFRKDKSAVILQIISFGFKYGIPIEADNVFDVRFIPNPFFIERFKNTTGLDKQTYEYVINQPQSQEFLKLMKEFFYKMIPNYVQEGKTYLTIAFGCTGGKHRSVAIVENIANMLKSMGYSATVLHRDIDR